jgi:hypothetical protein
VLLGARAAVREDDQMGWLIAIIGLIALVLFMIASPGFRYFIIALAVLGGLAIYGLIEKENKNTERREQERAAQERAALSAITPRDIALDKVQLKKEYASWTLTGNVTNNSKYRLGSLVFRVWIEDCPLPRSNTDWAVDNKKECMTIGQETARAYVSVPPGQMRAFSSAAIYFRGLPSTSNSRWRYEVTEIRAD